MRKYVLFFSGLFIASIGCRLGQSEKPVSGQATKIEIIELPQGFDSFYERFHADTLFQTKRIVFPLENNTTNLEIWEQWTKDNWILHRAYDDHGGTFRRSFQPIGTMVIEKIVEVNGMFYMERRFAKLSNTWNLIYYEVSVPTFDK